MFYKIIRFVAIGLIFLTMIMVFGFYFGWFNYSHILLFLRIFLITCGFYIFHRTHSKTKEETIIRLVKIPVHIIVLPVTIFSATIINNQFWSDNYWLYLNTSIIIAFSIALIDLVSCLKIHDFFKLFQMLFTFALSILVCMHMNGKFESGKIVLFMLIGYFFTFFTLLFFFTKVKKKGY